jgi:1,4-alpha-glucan branching enzyme
MRVIRPSPPLSRLTRLTRRSCLALFALTVLGLGGCTPDVAPVVPVFGTTPDASPGFDAGAEVLSDTGATDAASGPDAPSDALPFDAALPTPTLGANLEGAGAGAAVRFRVWAPNATGASVEGDFPEAKVAMTAYAGAAAVFEARVAGAHVGSRYHFVLETPAGTLTRVDPWCRQLVSGVDCAVVDPAAFAWKTSSFARPTREASVVYELHVGSFAVPAGAANGTFASTRAKLAALADLGVDVVELMPTHLFGSAKNSWGYSPQLWLAPRPSFGGADELRALVDDAHAAGLAVWLDVVQNHADGGSAAPLRCFDGACPSGSAGLYFFAPGTYATTPWGPRPDYTRTEVVDMLLGSVDQWLGEFRGDGFRVDSVSNVRAIDGAGTTPGGRELLLAMNARTHARGAISVAEDLKGYAPITAAPSAGGFGFDAQWDGFGYDVDKQLVGASDDARDLGVLQNVLSGSYNGDPFARLLFTEDHDTVGNGGTRLPDAIDPTNPTGWAARKRSMLGAVLLLSAPGVPMLFMGQEQLATGTFANPAAPLADATPAGLKIRAFYRDMIRLRRNLDGGAAGLLAPGIEIFHRNDAAKVLAYRRYGVGGQDVVVIVNLRNKAYAEYDIGVSSAGPWRVRLDTDWKSYADDFAGGSTAAITAVATTKDGKPFSLPLKLGAYSAMVLTR